MKMELGRWFIKIIIIISLIIYLPISCGTTKYVYLPGETKVEYRDTTIYKDSIQYTPIEVVKEIVPDIDTLTMSTSLAEAKAYLDTTNKVLRGEIKNKKGITNEIHYKEKIVYKDSIVTKPYPVEVQVEKIITKKPWYFGIVAFFSLIGLAWLIKIFINLYAKYKGA